MESAHIRGLADDAVLHGIEQLGACGVDGQVQDPTNRTTPPSTANPKVVVFIICSMPGSSRRSRTVAFTRRSHAHRTATPRHRQSDRSGPHYDGGLDEDTWVAISGYGPTKATVVDGAELFGRSDSAAPQQRAGILPVTTKHTK